MSSVTKICDYAPKSSPQQVCGMEIQWNDNLKGFESVKFPGFKHNHRLVCRTEGCGGDIFFNDFAPKGERSGRPQPLEIPIPVNKQWILHAHKKIISTEAAQRDPLEPVPSTVGQEKVVEAPQNNVVSASQTSSVPDPVPSTAGAKTAVEQSANELVSAMELQLRWQHDVLQPTFEDMKVRFERMMTPLETFVGLLVKAGFTTAAELKQVGENVIKQAEAADALAERQAQAQKQGS
jgi:hypothetical protein